MKINKYMHDHGISHETLAKVVAKNLRNGALNPNAFRRKPMAEEAILESPMLNYPLTQYMFCSPDEGAAAVVLCDAEHAHRYTDKPIYLKATTVRTRRLGAFEVHSPWLPIEETVGPTVDASRAAYEMAGIGPEDVDVIQLQDTDAGAEVIHLAENGFCADGDQETARRRGRARDRRRAPGQHRRRAHRERRADRRVGPAPGARSGAATPRAGRRAPGAGQPEGGLHAALRRARHRRRVDHVRLTRAARVGYSSRWAMACSTNASVVSCPAVTPSASSRAITCDRPVIIEQRDDRRQLLVGDAARGERGGDGLELGGAEPFGVARDLGADRLAVVRERDELDVERGAAEVGVELPERAQRSVGRDRAARTARDVLLGPAAEHLEEEVVHRAEVVVDELRLEAGLGRDPPRRDRGVALLEQQLLGRVEQLGAGAGVLGADPARRGGVVTRTPCHVRRARC